jgi:hypothetical protein
MNGEDRDFLFGLHMTGKLIWSKSMENILFGTTIGEYNENHKNLIFKELQYSQIEFSKKK